MLVILSLVRASHKGGSALLLVDGQVGELLTRQIAFADGVAVSGGYQIISFTIFLMGMADIGIVVEDSTSSTKYIVLLSGIPRDMPCDSEERPEVVAAMIIFASNTKVGRSRLHLLRHILSASISLRYVQCLISRGLERFANN